MRGVTCTPTALWWYHCPGASCHSFYADHTLMTSWGTKDGGMFMLSGPEGTRNNQYTSEKRTPSVYLVLAIRFNCAGEESEGRGRDEERKRVRETGRLYYWRVNQLCGSVGGNVGASAGYLHVYLSGAGFVLTSSCLC